jgi:hypothetical protein
VAREKPPAYQWYVTDARADRGFQRMTWEQQGMYRAMLDEQWDNCGDGLPDCPQACAELLGGPPEAWTTNWPVLRRKFVDRRWKPRDGEPVIHSDPDPHRRIINLKLARQWRDLTKYRRERQEAGRRGGQRKANNRKELRASTARAELENPLAKSTSSSSSSTSSSTSTPIRELPARARELSPSDAGDAFAERAGAFCEKYGELYAKHRKGARYLGKPNLDFLEALQLVQTWDDARLEKIATVFLTTDHEFAERGSRTMAQFRSMASWADGKLREAGL